MPAPTIRAIPKVAPEIPEATARVLRALKENVETLYGLRGGQSNVAELLGISSGGGGSGGAFLPLAGGTLTGDLAVEAKTFLGRFTHTADDQGNVVLFGNAAGTAAQAGSFRSKLVLYGGASQTRTLELYQVESGDAFINSSYTSNILGVTGFASMATPTVLYIGANRDMSLQRGSSNYIDVRNNGGAGTVSGFRFYDQADLGGYVRASGPALQLRSATNQIALNISSAGTSTIYHAGVAVALTRTNGFQVGSSTLAAPLLDIQSTAAGSPELRFLQTGDKKGSLQYLDSGDIFKLDGDGEIQLSPNNTTAFTLNTLGVGIFEGNVQVKGQAWSDAQTLTDGATISWNTDLGNAAVVTLAGNRTMAAPTNLKNGGTYTLKIVQDVTGTRTLTWNAVFKWPGGTAPVLSTVGSSIDVATFISDGTDLYGVLTKAFA